MTIQELIVLQKEESSGHLHLVFVHPDGFRIAHTQWERDEGFETMMDCELNDWFEAMDEAPVSTGVYFALEHDSEWELIPLAGSLD